jgi:hypothetical protein
VSETPRTNAKRVGLLPCSPAYAFEVMTGHAIDLECELAAMTAERDSLRDAVKRRDEVITLLHDELGRVRDVVGCVDVALIDDVFEAAKLKEAPK